MSLRRLFSTLLALTAAAALPGCAGGPSGKHAVAARAEAVRAGGIIADHLAVAEFEQIPAEAIALAKKKFAIHYARTSHGSQIDVGLYMLAKQLGAHYKVPWGFIKTVNGDLGVNGSLDWEKQTKKTLAGFGGSYNVVIWSWCGGATENDSAGIQAYLDAMERLEKKYPKIVFVYMTGHTNQWKAEVTRKNNAQIRAYCKQHGKVLFDFEDIESWDPAGNFYADAGDDCKWCESWCGKHPCPTCGVCSHSHCYNCYIKGQAFWWMMARMAGWPGLRRGPDEEAVPEASDAVPEASDAVPEASDAVPEASDAVPEASDMPTGE